MRVQRDRKVGEPLQSIARPISSVVESTNCLTMLTSFPKHRKHIAIVYDEYGGLDGLVTMEDLMETVLGDEIIDKTDRIVDLQKAARKCEFDSKTGGKEDKL